MDHKTHKTAVVVIPPEAASSPIQAIRKQHDRGFRRWMPHITLLYPFRPWPEFEAAAARLEQVCEALPSFEVTLATFHAFEQGRESYTLWLAPEPAEELIRLQTALWQAFPDCDEVRQHAGGFTPHLSVGQVRGREKMERFMADWQRSWAPIRFQVVAVSLIWRGEPPDDVFRVGCAVRLGVA